MIMRMVMSGSVFVGGHLGPCYAEIYGITVSKRGCQRSLSVITGYRWSSGNAERRH